MEDLPVASLLRFFYGMLEHGVTALMVAPPRHGGDTMVDAVEATEVIQSLPHSSLTLIKCQLFNLQPQLSPPLETKMVPCEAHPPSVFVDFDGTLSPYEMHYVVCEYCGPLMQHRFNDTFICIDAFAMITSRCKTSDCVSVAHFLHNQIGSFARSHPLHSGGANWCSSDPLWWHAVLVNWSGKRGQCNCSPGCHSLGSRCSNPHCQDTTPSFPTYPDPGPMVL